MRIYLTGASGLLGGELLPLLQAAGHEVVGRERIDVRDREAIRRAIVGASPDWVIHLAAYTRVDDAEGEAAEAARVNIAGTTHVAQAAVHARARLLTMSTDYVYDGAKGSPYVEDDPPRPISAYGWSKLGGEAAAQAIASQCLIVRGGWLYGPGKGFIHAILRAAALDRPLKVVTDEVGSPTAAEDLGRGIVALIEIGATGIVHVANTGGTSRFELARSVLALAGHDPDRVHPTTQVEFGSQARRPPDSRLATARFAELTGQPLRPYEEALAEQMAAFLATGTGGAGRATSSR